MHARTHAPPAPTEVPHGRGPEATQGPTAARAGRHPCLHHLVLLRVPHRKVVSACACACVCVNVVVCVCAGGRVCACARVHMHIGEVA